jgi:hypothetical protein
MTKTTRTQVRALVVAGMAAALTGVLGVAVPQTASAASAPDTAARSLPWVAEAIKPPAGSRLVGVYVVVAGTQNYTCVTADGAATGAYTGASVPEARLLGTGGWLHHFAGPSWQSTRDGSLVTAAKVSSSARDGAIPELLLKVATHSGKGVLSRADYINRLLTSGGVAPTGTCKAGKTVKVPYGSIYVFWDDPAV